MEATAIGRKKKLVADGSARYGTARGDGKEEGSGLVLAQYRSCSHLDYILELITKEDGTPPLVQFLRETCWERM